MEEPLYVMEPPVRGVVDMQEGEPTYHFGFVWAGRCTYQNGYHFNLPVSKIEEAADGLSGYLPSRVGDAKVRRSLCGGVVVKGAPRDDDRRFWKSKVRIKLDELGEIRERVRRASQ